MSEEMKDREQETQTTDNQAGKKPETNPAQSADVNTPEGDSADTQAMPEENLTDLDKAKEIVARYQVELRNTEKERDSLKNQLMRLQADFENQRKRQRKELGDTVRFANQDLLKDLLPVLDNFDRTLKAIDKTDNLAAIKEGIGMVSSSMQRQLAKIGLEPIKAVGEDFDSNFHEAVTSIPAPDESQVGKVIDEVEKGYKLKDRVIRFSKVIVGE
ncbi:nucleotide exchange factor GrpE [Pontibacter sp. G13]|uniref:nucleotide exchange factor GrpE n=1 Tax=Pontibacter sp. G13 TaxID=3074898 RepID=UPI00288C09D9|nr:nucleotide exchange factor GrpE [Pontibacter sp. G13]WNJ21235.1 nucleotide exchange factor GrpE [Pontibacter sp. G13]